jgi:DNA-binding NarL/FixJ family response regulator
MSRVLVVDDDADYRLVIRLALDGSDLIVIGEAARMEEAVALAASEQPDLLLLDCTLGESDAFEAFVAVRSSAPGCQTILLSSHARADLRMASRALGACGFLSKGTPARSLASEIATIAGLVAAAQTALQTAAATFTGDDRSPGEARRLVRGALASSLASSADDELLDSATLLVSELVTNAVVHAGSEVDVVVRIDGSCLRVEVSDTSDVAPRMQAPTPDETSGRGLPLVEALASRWGVAARPAGGKSVWFELERTTSQPVR